MRQRDVPVASPVRRARRGRLPLQPTVVAPVPRSWRRARRQPGVRRVLDGGYRGVFDVRGTPVQLANVQSYTASWPRGGHTGYVTLTNHDCFGIAEIRDGVVAPSTAKVTLNGTTWPLSPGPQGCPPDTGAARNPAVSPDGHHASLDSVPWQLIRIDDDGSSVPLGPTLPGLTGTVMSPDGRTVAVAERPGDPERDAVRRALPQ